MSWAAPRSPSSPSWTARRWRPPAWGRGTAGGWPTGARERASEEERYRVSRLLLRTVLGPFLANGVVHADPHPGNYLLMPDGRLGVVDFGSIKRLPDRFTGACRRLLALGLSGEPFDVVPVARELGIVWGDLPDDQARDLMNEVLEIGGKPLRPGPFDYATSTMVGDLRALKTTRFRQLLKFRPP